VWGGFRWRSTGSGVALANIWWSAVWERAATKKGEGA
jgi:hypothetical protein